LEPGVPAGRLLPVPSDRDFAVAPLLGRVRALVVDRHPAGTVLAGRDLAVEVRVLHRMVLGVHGEVVARRVAGQAAGYRPGDQYPVAFQPQIPVQPAGVVLLDHEDITLSRLGRFCRYRLRGAPGVAPAPVLGQPVCHTAIVRCSGEPGWVSIRRKHRSARGRSLPWRDSACTETGRRTTK